ncbi:MAG: adenosylhomocysteinase [Candidatus Kerfeldbacteria bacterium]|nr:adenosylhomocysteinase [Candidatus Kerfeldbacteria bacterium]
MSKGKNKILWAARQMPVLAGIAERFVKVKPLLDVRISACLHVTSETANLALALKSGGASLRLCASNPLSTQDEVVQSLKRDYKIPVFARRGVTSKQYYQDIKQCLGPGPQLTVDDGADLVTYLHTKTKRLLKGVWGGTEETTTGVLRLQAMAKARQLRYPVMAVNSALTKHLFDNRYGTGQSTIDGILRATNILLAGKIIVVVGYGWCGRGVAARARGMGARVIVTEVNPIRVLEAQMDGYEVMPMLKAAKLGQVFITTTGNRDVITREHIKLMPEGAILANAGHFDVEVDVAGLKKMAKSVATVRPQVEEYELPDGRKIYLLAQGRLVNLAAAEGHPASVMDMSFANQALALEYLVQNHKVLKPAVYTVPPEIDLTIAELKLRALGVGYDTLTPKQRRYLEGWKFGT